MPVAYGDDDRPAEPAAAQWYERPGAVFAAGVAGLAVVGLLVFAVVQTSRHSSTPSGTEGPMTSTTTTASAARSTTRTTTTASTTQTTSETTSTEPPTTQTTVTEATTEATTTTGTTTMSVPYPTTTTPRLNF
jgi:cytoskeletal protein RodZ